MIRIRWLPLALVLGIAACESRSNMEPRYSVPTAGPSTAWELHGYLLTTSLMDTDSAEVPITGVTEETLGRYRGVEVTAKGHWHNDVTLFEVVEVKTDESKVRSHDPLN